MGRGRKTNIKPPLASFLGREEELAMLHRMLATDRLVTLHGTAGTGKTRLAMRYGELHAGEWDGGVWFVDLTAASDLEGVCAAVGRALDLPLLARGDEDAVLDQLGQALDAVLIILDNCEQCASAAARAVTRWLELAPHARFIATSRELLRVAGERVDELGPLGEDAAVRLFADRAGRVRPGYAIAPGEMQNVVEICRHLDGLPLAIELAAARMSIMGTADIVKRLPQRFDLLASSTRGMSERQRTLRGAIDWSWDLSSEWERSALVQCAVFRGAFPLESAERVIDLSQHADAPAPLDAVRVLRDKSYLCTVEPPELPGEMWLTMYESIREFALEKLEPDRRAAAARHAAHYADVGDALVARVWSSEAVDTLRRIGAMSDNLLAAHEHALATGDPTLAARVAIALERVGLDRGPHGAYATLYDRTIAAAEGKVPDALLARLLVARSFLRMLRVNRAAAREDANRAASMARALGDAVLEVRALQVVGQVAVPEHEDDVIAAVVERLSEIASSTSDNHLEGLARMVIGLLFVVRGQNLEEAHTALDRSLRCLRAVGDVHRIATVLNVLGVLLAELDRADEAYDILRHAIEMCRETNDRFREASCLAYLGGVCIQSGRIDEACESTTAAALAFSMLGERWQQALARGMLGAALALKGDVDGASNALDRAEEELSAVGDEVYVTAIRVHRGQLDLARARACEASGDVVGAARHRKSAAARLGADESVSDDVRFAARMLRRELARMPEVLRAVPSEDALIVGAGGLWFRSPRGKRVDLGSRRTLQLLLETLAERRASTPGMPVSVETLLSSGWPGERVLRDAATNRVRVAMTTLRRLGLATVLKSAHDGYWLDRDVPLVVA